MSDPLDQFKAMQREGWKLFTPLEAITTIPAAELVRFAGVSAGQRLLDVGCGTGVVALTAARQGAKVQGLDLTPTLLERAKENAALAGLEIQFQEGDAEALPYPDASFDVVLSQFGHMFAPRPEVAIKEMLRVLVPGGRIAFSTWPPEMFVGRLFQLLGRYLPPPPPGVSPSPEWGDANIVRTRLGDAVSDIEFDRGVLRFPALSLQHYRLTMESTLAPVVKLVSTASAETIAKFRSEFDALTATYYSNNTVHQHFLMSRARKR